jgi:hypothetical protein
MNDGKGPTLEQQSADPKFLSGDDQRPLGAKVLAPAMLILAGILLAKAPTTRPAGLVLCAVVIVLGAVQFVVVGLVKPTEECLFYRRFFKWRRIEYSDIVKCGRPIFPLFWGLHYLKLRNFEPPLGRLYFVQCHPFQYHPARSSQRELDQETIERIRAGIAGMPAKKTDGMVAMGKSRKTIVGFALLGLAITGACYAYTSFYDYAKPMNGLKFALVAISVILCPPQLLFAICIDCDVVGWSGFTVYSIIGVLNALLYAAIGPVLVSTRKNRADSL